MVRKAFFNHLIAYYKSSGRVVLAIENSD